MSFSDRLVIFLSFVGWTFSVCVRGVCCMPSRGCLCSLRDTGSSYQLAIRAFLAYVCEPLYGWDIECEKRFRTHPVQISHDWNSAKHVLDAEGRPQRRALTRPELQQLFDAADEMVEEIRRRGRGVPRRGNVEDRLRFWASPA